MDLVGIKTIRILTWSLTKVSFFKWESPDLWRNIINSISAMLCSIFNSMANPIVYTILMPNYRKAMMSTIVCKKEAEISRERTKSTDVTSVSDKVWKRPNGNQLRCLVRQLFLTGVTLLRVVLQSRKNLEGRFQMFLLAILSTHKPYRLTTTANNINFNTTSVFNVIYFCLD